MRVRLATPAGRRLKTCILVAQNTCFHQNRFENMDTVTIKKCPKFHEFPPPPEKKNCLVKIYFCGKLRKFTLRLQRTDLFQKISQTLGINFGLMSHSLQLRMLLHGDNLGGGDGRAVAYHFQNFLFNSSRFFTS